MADVRSHFLVCTGGGCIASGALDVSEAVRAELAKRGLADEVNVVETGCLGPCVAGPGRARLPRRRLLPERARRRRPPRSSRSTSSRAASSSGSCSHAPGTDKTQAEMNDIPFFNRQVKIVLRNCGHHRPAQHRRVHRPRGLPGARQGAHRDDARGGHRRGARQRPARPRRRRLPHRHEVAVRRSSRTTTPSTSSATPTRATPAPSWTARVLEGDPHSRHRGHGHRRLRHRRAPGLRLRARRVPARRRAPRARPRAGARVRPARRRHHGHGLRLRPRDPHGRRAPSSAARRPR